MGSDPTRPVVRDFGFINDPPATSPQSPTRDFSFLNDPGDSGDGASGMLDSVYQDLGIKRGFISGVVDTLAEGVMALGDVLPGGDPFNPIQVATKVFEDTHAFSGQLIDRPLATAKGVVVGMLQPLVQYPLELLTNYNVAESRDLTPDERYTRSRSFTANSVGLIVGALTRSRVGGMFARQSDIIGKPQLRGLEKLAKFEDELTNRGAIATGLQDLTQSQLYQLGRTARTPRFARNAIVGIAEGAAGGFATGYLEGTTLEDRLGAGIAYGMLAVPFGVGLEAAMSTVGRVARGSRPDVSELIAEEAVKVAHYRQFNAVYDKTPMELAFDLNNVIETGSIPIAWARRHMQYDVTKLDENGIPTVPGRNAVVIPGVRDPGKVFAQIQNLEGQPHFEPLIHTRDDGLSDVLLAPLGQLNVKERSFFERTGFLNGQQVEYQGNHDFYISDVVSKRGRAKPQAVLTQISTGAVLDEPVPLNKIGRPGTTRYGDLMVYQRRSITTEDIFDPAQGFTSKGGNFVKRGGLGTNNPVAFESYVLEIGEDYIAGDVPRPRDSSEARGIAAHDRMQQLAPGVHEFNRGNHGMLLIMGGIKQKKRVSIGEGAYQTVEFTIGEPGQPVGVVMFSEQKSRSGKMVRGSEYAAMLDETVLGTEPRRALSALYAEARNKYGLLRSFDSLSQGSAVSLARFTNKYNPQVDPANFGYINPETFAADALDAFYSYIGLDGDGPRINPDDLVSYVGFENPVIKEWGDPSAGIVSVLWGEGGVGGEPFIARPGQTTEGLRNKLAPELSRKLDQVPGHTRYFSESKRQLTKDEAIRLLEDQNQRGEVPTLRTRDDFPIDRREMTFNDLFNSFIKETGINPDHAYPLRTFFEREMAQELLGVSNRKRSVDMRSVPWLEERVRVHDAAIKTLQDVLEDFDVDEPETPYHSRVVADALERNQQFKTTDQMRGALAELVHHRDVFQNRLELMREAAPPPFSAEEHAVLKRLAREAAKLREKAASDLLQVADAHGFMVERSGGMIKLRNHADGSFTEVPRAFRNAEEAAQWIQTADAALGIELDGGSGGNLVPPGAAGGGAGTPPGPPVRAWETPYEFPKDSKIGQVMQWFDSVVPWATTKRSFFTATDNKFGTKLFASVFLPLQMAKLRLESTKRPALERLQGIEKAFVDAQISPERREIINQYRRTRSPSDIVNGVYADRVMTATEISHAQNLAERGVDATRVFEYLRKFERLDEKYQQSKSQMNDPESLAKLDALHQSAVAKLNDSFMMDQPHLDAVALFRKVRTGNAADVKLHGIIRLMEAYKNGEVGRDQFAAMNNMTDAELKIANMVDEQWSTLAGELGVDSRLEEFIAAFAATTEFTNPGRVSRTMKETAKEGIKAALPEDAQDFAYDMIRNGELNVYETDPLRQLVQLVNAGHNNRGFNKQWKEAFKAAEAEFKRMPQGSSELAQRVTNEYLYGLKGFKASADVLMQESVQKTLEGLNMKLNLDVTRDYVNTVLAAQSGAMLGFRPMQGIRDFHGFLRNYYTRFGLARTQRAFELAFTRDPATGKLPMRTLAESGETPGLGIIEFLTDEEISNAVSGKTTGTLKSLIFKTSKAGLELSGQSTSYGIAHAMSYLETMKHSADVFKRLSEEKITKQRAYKELRLNTYDIPFAEHIDDLVTSGKFEDAAKTLAHETGAETAFIFGLSNHPLGWSTNIGRMLSQFGTWSVHARDFLRRAASRGTGSERAASIARFASAETAMALGGATLGFNVRSWYMLPGVIFLGGPAFNRMQQMEELMGLRGSSRKNIAEMELEVYNGKVPFISEMIPGSYAFADYLRAYELMQRGFNPIPVTARALGFTINEKDRSLVDELLGNYPR